ncbi:MAG: diguanylate cyclase, partial [Thermoanaerobaculia bacterium]
EVCATREAGLALIRRRVPDAIVVDALLPDGSGYDVIETLRAEGGQATGVIVMTVAYEFADKMRAMRCGADAFLGKPLDLPALVRRLNVFRARKERPPRRILAVEDDPTQVLLLRRILGDAGYEVAICSETAQFEKMLDSFAPDLLLMDVQLSDRNVNGYDLVRFVRQNERFATLPVIFVTGENARKAMLDSTLSGGDVLVTKPVDWDLLLAQVASRLERATAMRELTDRDPLTGLLTRGAFESRATGRPAVLVLLDVDRFKDVNDRFGHAAGDRVLAALGTFLRRRLRQTDLVSRYGGEEFAMVLDDTTAEDAARLVERLLAEFGALEHGEVGRVTFSAGVAKLDASFEASFRRADAALYEAKRSGRARVVFA